MHNIDNKIEFRESITLVIGNMIGAGIFMLPISLSEYGSISIFGWIISGLIAIVLAKIFKKLSKKYPGESGPFTYTNIFFGEFIAFVVVWGYWVSILLLNASLAIAVTSYSTVFIPELANQYYNISFSIFIIFIISIIGYKGIRGIGNFQFYTTVIKIIPLILTVIIGFLFFNIENFFPLNISTETDFKAITISTTLTFFAFLGIESATVPEDKIKNPIENVSKATSYGVGFTFILYILSTIALIGILSPEQIQDSNAPFADAGGVIFGDYARYIMAFFAIVSALGCLNGWTLLQIELPKNLSKNNLFPEVFSKENSNKVPISGLIISNIIVVGLISMNYSKDLSNIFTYLILTSTFCTLILYLLLTIGEIVLIFKNKKYLGTNFISIPVFLFLIWMIIGVGYDSILLGLLLLSISIPIYFYQKYYARYK
ncbi:MAG: amino acid permease [Flammeovirgaceae bacterium]|nr:amino acid permease [Flammeovirgaceae bacterium]